MSKHKRKVNTFQLQKLQAAQHKKVFCRWMQKIFNTVAGEDIYKLIPAYIIDHSYENRLRYFKVIAADGHDVPDEILKETKASISTFTKGHFLEIKPSGMRFTFEEFFTYCSSATWLKQRISAAQFPAKEKILMALESFDADTLIDNDINTEIGYLMRDLGMNISETGKYYYWMDFRTGIPDTINRNNNVIIVRRQGPETRQVDIDGSHRPAYRVGWPYEGTGVKWAKIKPSALNIKSPFADIPVDVYLQSHALQRLAERMDRLPIALLHYCMYLSFFEPKICYDQNNRVLVEFLVNGIKAGYFRVEFIEGIVVIKTFLFITNNGTPEAQLLEKNTGLQKSDKQFLAIDKASTFINWDIANNAELQKILKDAGCGSLIELSRYFKVLANKASKTSDIESFLNYISKTEDLNPVNWME